MAWFTVQYRDKNGARAEAEFEAADRTALFKSLSAKNITPVKVLDGRLAKNKGAKSGNVGRGTLAGLIVTAVVNIVFMPRYSYWASAFGHLASYLVMFVISAALGAKYYPIPYRWGRLLLIFLLMGVFYGAALLVGQRFFPGGGLTWLQLGINTLLIIGYCAALFPLLKPAWRQVRSL